MKKFVDTLIELKSAHYKINRLNSKVKSNWEKEKAPFSFQYTITKNDLLKYDFTRTDIHRMLENCILKTTDIGRKATLKLILDGKLDFYKVGAEGQSKDDISFTAKELKQILECEHFYRTAKAGMQCEPVVLLNARTLVIYQHNISSEMIMEILDKVDITKTLKSKKRKFIELARREKNSEFELLLELMEGK